MEPTDDVPLNSDAEMESCTCMHGDQNGRNDRPPRAFEWCQSHPTTVSHCNRDRCDNHITFASSEGLTSSCWDVV